MFENIFTPYSIFQIKNCEFNSFKVKKNKYARFSKQNNLITQKK